jgi:hypothetical protein
VRYHGLSKPFLSLTFRVFENNKFGGKNIMKGENEEAGGAITQTKNEEFTH